MNTTRISLLIGILALLFNPDVNAQSTEELQEQIEVLNRQISNDAERIGTLCNIADRPEVCNFILPAIISRGDLMITISTSGKSPALAKKLRYIPRVN